MHTSEATNWTGDWERGEGEAEIGGLASLKRETSARKKIVRVLEMGLEKVNMRRKSMVQRDDLIAEMIGRNYNWDDSIPVAVHVEEGLEKCVTSSTRESDSRRGGRRSRRASILAKLKWLGNQESSS